MIGSHNSSNYVEQPTKHGTFSAETAINEIFFKKSLLVQNECNLRLQFMFVCMFGEQHESSENLLLFPRQSQRSRQENFKADNFILRKNPNKQVFASKLVSGCLLRLKVCISKGSRRKILFISLRSTPHRMNNVGKKVLIMLRIY